MGNCSLCGASAIVNKQESSSRTIYSCPQCGVFVISDLAEKEAYEHADEIKAFLARRALLKSNDTLLISYEKAKLDKDYLQLTVDRIVDAFPKSHAHQTEMILKNLELLSGFGGDEIEIADLKYSPLFYLKHPSLDALSSVIHEMRESGLIDVNFYNRSFFPCSVSISSKGREKLIKLNEKSVKNRSLLVFVSKSDKQIFNPFLKAVRKAVLDSGVNYALNIPHTGAEDKAGNALISGVKKAKTVICDLTEHSGEAYYVAAFAGALHKTCLLTCNQSAEKELRINADELGVIIWDKEEQLYLELLNALKADI
ncbi:MAG: hypothetical protein FWG94_12975 [Oscillospiraceae bacterium]|nr:hypothetical protein [Oscillospiraceae bacterium]